MEEINVISKSSKKLEKEKPKEKEIIEVVNSLLNYNILRMKNL